MRVYYNDYKEICFLILLREGDALCVTVLRPVLQAPEVTRCFYKQLLEMNQEQKLISFVVS